MDKENLTVRLYRQNHFGCKIRDVSVLSDGYRDPAPFPLRLVQEFLNTNDNEGKHERFASPGALRDWLGEHGLIDPASEITGEQLTQAIELRESLRALAAVHNQLPADAAGAIRVVNQAAADARLMPSLTSPDELALEPQVPGVAGALGRIVAVVHQAIADDTWTRLKACERDSCRWAFYDHSKNRSGRWCHSAVCGNRERSRRAYHRRRAALG
jgi:predicted RNA-binding Zn ribbon-like protein